MMQKNGTLYLEDGEHSAKQLFDAVLHEINTCSLLKTKLPYQEFVLPARKVIEKDPGWVGHFEDPDNQKFFLSDVHDYLYLKYGRN